MTLTVDDLLDRLADRLAARLGNGGANNHTITEPTADPWVGTTGQNATTAGNGQPAAVASSAPNVNNGSQNVVTVPGPNGPSVWSFNVPNAPQCNCGLPAGHVRGTTSKGKPYTAFRCAKGAGNEWRNKCDFNQWV